MFDVKLMNGRYFAQRRLEAEVCKEKIRYLKSSSKEDEDEDEKQRLEKYAEFLEKQG
jgi:HIV Tat-specific factor 1